MSLCSVQFVLLSLFGVYCIINYFYVSENWRQFLKTTIDNMKYLQELIFGILFPVTFVFPSFLDSATIECGLHIIMPYSSEYNKKISGILPRIQFYANRRRFPDLNQNYFVKIKDSIVDGDEPRKVLDLFCDSIFPEKMNTILYLKLNPKTRIPTEDYIVEIATMLGYPVISWDPEFPGALQVRLFLSFLPYCFHISFI